MLAGVNEDIALPLLAQRPAIRELEDGLACLAGRRIMVTGAGGSIGSELSIQIAAHKPAALLLVDQSEFGLYEINRTIDNARVSCERVAAIADVRDPGAIAALFHAYRPELVFHAAALKHVPLLESDHNLIEAVRTNVHGTRLLLEQCVEHRVDFVFVSTDKAVNPSSGMGLTKRVAEIATHSAADRHPEIRIAQVRFGNVMGSSGSVVPLFRRQIAAGGPVTITHPDVTRYMMTIKEAVGLVLQAAQLSRETTGYGCYVLDMGKPVRIYDLACQLIEQAGLRPFHDMPVQIIGMRRGEKLFEELHYEWETLDETRVKGVRRAATRYVPGEQERRIADLCVQARNRDVDKLKSTLAAIVPEYQGAEITW